MSKTVDVVSCLKKDKFKKYDKLETNTIWNPSKDMKS